ncbi:MAG: hypothetical protein ACRC5M_02855 [Anaeroplasmataceae bacterium]
MITYLNTYINFKVNNTNIEVSIINNSDFLVSIINNSIYKKSENIKGHERLSVVTGELDGIIIDEACSVLGENYIIDKSSECSMMSLASKNFTVNVIYYIDTKTVYSDIRNLNGVIITSSVGSLDDR